MSLKRFIKDKKVINENNKIKIEEEPKKTKNKNMVIGVVSIIGLCVVVTSFSNLNTPKEYSIIEGINVKDIRAYEDSTTIDFDFKISNDSKSNNGVGYSSIVNVKSLEDEKNSLEFRVETNNDGSLYMKSPAGLGLKSGKYIIELKGFKTNEKFLDKELTDENFKRHRENTYSITQEIDVAVNSSSNEDYNNKENSNYRGETKKTRIDEDTDRYEIWLKKGEEIFLKGNSTGYLDIELSDGESVMDKYFHDGVGYFETWLGDGKIKAYVDSYYILTVKYNHNQGYDIDWTIH